jgi:hypothetical protein
MTDLLTSPFIIALREQAARNALTASQQRIRTTEELTLDTLLHGSTLTLQEQPVDAVGQKEIRLEA